MGRKGSPVRGAGSKDLTRVRSERRAPYLCCSTVPRTDLTPGESLSESGGCLVVPVAHVFRHTRHRRHTSSAISTVETLRGSPTGTGDLNPSPPVSTPRCPFVRPPGYQALSTRPAPDPATPEW